MKNSDELKQCKVKELSSLARKLGISGWHDMRKADLIAAILANTDAGKANFVKATLPQKSGSGPASTSKSERKGTQKSSATAGQAQSKPTGEKSRDTSQSVKSRSVVESGRKKSGDVSTRKKAKNSSSLLPVDVAPLKKKAKLPEKSDNSVIPSKKRRNHAVEHRERASKTNSSLVKPGVKKPMLTGNLSGVYEEVDGKNRDRFVLLVRDPFWLHVYWELCVRLIERAKAAMGHSWHTAVPVLRLFRIVADGMNNPRRDLVRDLRIHDGVNNWYIDVQDPPGTFQVEIGFLSRENHFFPVASSNIVQTPRSQVVSGTARLDGHWGSVSEDFDRIYKLSGGLGENNKQLKTVFEERLHRSMSLPLLSRFGARSASFEKTKRHFDFIVDADVVIYGKTDPSVQVSIKDEPIRVANDGSFSVRYTLSEKRQVFPIDAKGSDGIETQQVILAIERNTKVLETVFLDNDDDD